MWNKQTGPAIDCIFPDEAEKLKGYYVLLTLQKIQGSFGTNHCIQRSLLSLASGGKQLYIHSQQAFF